MKIRRTKSPTFRSGSYRKLIKMVRLVTNIKKDTMPKHVERTSDVRTTITREPTKAKQTATILHSDQRIDEILTKYRTFSTL